MLPAPSLTFSPQNLKEGKNKGENQLIDAISGLVQHIPDQDRRPIQDMLVNIRSHQQATA